MDSPHAIPSPKQSEREFGGFNNSKKLEGSLDLQKNMGGNIEGSEMVGHEAAVNEDSLFHLGRDNNCAGSRKDGCGFVAAWRATSDLGGVQASNSGFSNLRNETFFFKSADNIQRPKKKTFKSRPNSKRFYHQRNVSPNSVERPRKRVREDEIFCLDLNMVATEANSIG
ncbi:hypothetical protein Hanom_Chr16g01445871 [Helianthus anomalus]